MNVILCVMQAKDASKGADVHVSMRRLNDTLKMQRPVMSSILPYMAGEDIHTCLQSTYYKVHTHRQD